MSPLVGNINQLIAARSARIAGPTGPEEPADKESGKKKSTKIVTDLPKTVKDSNDAKAKDKDEE